MDFYPFFEERTSIIQSSDKQYSRNAEAYTFTTANNIEYLVLFRQADAYFRDLCTICHNIYEVVIQPIKYKKPPPKDYNVGTTIAEIVNHFYFIKGNSYDKVLFFICDDNDCKEHLRFELFKRWYHQHSLMFQGFEFHERIVDFNNYTLYSAMILNPRFPDMEKLLGELDMACEAGFNFDDPQ